MADSLSNISIFLYRLHIDAKMLLNSIYAYIVVVLPTFLLKLECKQEICGVGWIQYLTGNYDSKSWNSHS